MVVHKFLHYTIIITIVAHVLRNTCAFTVITCLSRDIDIYKKKILGHIYFTISQGHNTFARLLILHV